MVASERLNFLLCEHETIILFDSSFNTAQHGWHATSSKARSQDSTEKKRLFYSIPSYRSGTTSNLFDFLPWSARDLNESSKPGLTRKERIILFASSLPPRKTPNLFNFFYAARDLNESSKPGLNRKERIILSDSYLPPRKKHQIYLIFFHGRHATPSKARRQDSIDRGVVWLLPRD